MDSEQLVRAVRTRLGPGRLLPLGTRDDDGLWLAERAAVTVLRDTAAGLAGVRLETVRVVPDGRENGGGAAERVRVRPPGALPPGTLRVLAECAAGPDEPLPEAAARLRRALATAAGDRLGLDLTGVEVAVTGLLDGPAPAADTPGPAPQAGADGHTPSVGEAPSDGDVPGAPRGAALRAVLAVPGVTRPDPVLGAAARAVGGPGQPGAGDRDAVLVQVAVDAGRPVLDTARAAHAAAVEAAGGTAVALLVTAVDRAAPPS